MKQSHLGVESQQNKPYGWKAECDFCRYRYNTELSDAMNPSRWCSTECEIQDKYETTAYIEHQKEKPL